MADQVFVLYDLVKREKGGTLSLQIKLFAEGVDAEVDGDGIPQSGGWYFDKTETADIKAQVEGKDREELVADAVRVAGIKLRDAVVTYLRVQEYKALVDIGPVISAIETALGA